MYDAGIRTLHYKSAWQASEEEPAMLQSRQEQGETLGWELAALKIKRYWISQRSGRLVLWVLLPATALVLYRVFAGQKDLVLYVAGVLLLVAAGLALWGYHLEWRYERKIIGKENDLAHLQTKPTFGYGNRRPPGHTRGEEGETQLLAKGEHEY